MRRRLPGEMYRVYRVRPPHATIFCILGFPSPLFPTFRPYPSLYSTTPTPTISPTAKPATDSAVPLMLPLFFVVVAAAAALPLELPETEVTIVASEVAVDPARNVVVVVS